MCFYYEIIINEAIGDVDNATVVDSLLTKLFYIFAGNSFMILTVSD